MTGGVDIARVETGAPLAFAFVEEGNGGLGGELIIGCCCSAFAAAEVPPSGDGDLGGGDPPSLVVARGRLLLVCSCAPCSLSLLSPPRSPLMTSNAALPSSPPTLSGASLIDPGSHPLAALASLLSCLATRDQSTWENACAARAARRPQLASKATRCSPAASISPSVAALAATPTKVLWK